MPVCQIGRLYLPLIDVSHANQLTDVDSELEGISESSVNDLDVANAVDCVPNILGLSTSELGELGVDEFQGVSELFSTSFACRPVKGLDLTTGELIAMQAADGSLTDFFVLANGESD